MPKRGRTQINIADYKATKRDEGAIEITGEGGTVFTIDPPALWPQEALDAAKAEDSEGMAKAILGGEEIYALFLAEGGTLALLNTIIDEQHGAEAGK